MKTFLIIINISVLVLFSNTITAKEYYIHPKYGKDSNSGHTKKTAFQTLNQISKLKLLPGDKVFLASNEIYFGSLNLINQSGSAQLPIIITSISWRHKNTNKPAQINFKNYANGILIEDCSFITVSNLDLTGNGYTVENQELNMRCGIKLTTKNTPKVEHINIQNITIHEVFYENFGFKRGKDEVKTANGSQKYGWGIRIINESVNSIIENCIIENCTIKNVSHTGLKLTGKNRNIKNIKNIKILNNTLLKTGGPGIQMSEVEKIYVAHNKVINSGCNDDSRKWGRGSGLWTWGSSNVLIEKNEFKNANGPGDSAGAHIDYNCDNIVLQYNFSANNAGGFCEILGNNYNCMYRYNLSVNDGWRIKGVDGAFQEGKVFWLSGYQGNKQPKKGPVNSYFYNNTIYSDHTIEAKFAIENSSQGIVIVNNIFCIKGGSKTVLGDQDKRDGINKDTTIENVFFKNNLFLNETTWPSDLKIKDAFPIIGNPLFDKEGGDKISDYTPKNKALLQKKGIEIPVLPKSNIELLFDLKMEKDLLGNNIIGTPSIGAIEIE